MKTNNTSNIRSIALKRVELPQFVEQKGKQWVSYGKANDYPSYLVKLYSESSKHNAIIGAKASYVLGKGVNFSKDNLADPAPYSKFLNKINPSESLNTFLKKIVLDNEIFNGFAIEAIPNRGGTGWFFYHIDFSKVRSNAEHTEFYYSDHWDDKKTSDPSSKPDFKKLRRFDGKPGKEKKIIYVAGYRPCNGVYPLPDYLGAITSIETDIRISNFHFNNLKNGFNASKIVNFNNGVPTPEEQDAIAEGITDKFSGDENAGTIFIAYNDGQDGAVTVEDMTAGDFGEQFSQLRKDVDQEIFVGHKITSPMLFGCRVEGQLGGRNELIESFELFQNGYVNERQQSFQLLINELAEIMGLEPRFEIIPTKSIKPDFSDTTFISDATLFQILSMDEMREELGREPVETSIDQKIIEQINLLNPRVALPVIQSMTINEQRKIIGLPPIPEGNVLVQEIAPKQSASPDQAMQVELNDDNDIPVFLKYGVSKSKFEIIHKRAVNFRSMTDAKKFSLKFKDFASVTAEEKKILDKISKGKKPDITTDTENRLREKNLIERDAKGTLVVTDLGELVLADIPELSDKKLSELKVVYEYDKRPDEPGPSVLSTTRPFCKAMVESDKYFTRQDIAMISAEVDYDVWTQRGGWMTLSDGNHRPSCRHIWHQILVKEIV